MTAGKEYWEQKFERFRSVATYNTPVMRDDSPIFKQAEFFKVRFRDGNRLLDAGCGFGAIPLLLAREGFEVHAFDISENAIDFAKRWAESQNLDVTFQVASASEFKTELQFNFIRAASLLDHMALRDARKVLETFATRLPTGGRLFCSFDGEKPGGNDYDREPDGTRIYNAGSLKGLVWRHYSDKEIRDILIENGFNIIEIETPVTGGGARHIYAEKK